jgi:hypothetical protein
MKVIDSNLPPAIENPSWLRRLLNRFCQYETMSGNGVCPVYLERWVIKEAFSCGIYLHHFIGDDWAIDPHDHPRRFISIGLKGWYYEDVFNSDGTQADTLRFDAPWVRSFPAEHLHRVRASQCGDCWTLVIVLPKTRRWGFVKDGQWIGFKDYVFGGKYRKSC